LTDGQVVAGLVLLGRERRDGADGDWG